ncbi:MAG: hypothetical protein ABL931_04410 [Usitatibacteraceae bacterium]
MNDYTNIRIDYTTIEHHMRQARLERSAALGEAIANGIMGILATLQRGGRYLNVLAYQLTKTPDSYSTSLRRP